MDDTIVLKTEDGNEVEYTVITTFYWDITGKSYVLYTDGSCNEKGETNVFASSYSEKDPNQLFKIETGQELAVVAEVIKEVQQEMQEEEN